MAWFNDLKLRMKLMLSFGVVLVLLGAVGYVGVTRMSGMSGQTTILYKKHLLGLHDIMQANIDLVTSGRAEKNAILADDKAETEKHAASARKSLTSVADELTKFEATVILPEIKKELAQVQLDLKDLSAGRERVLVLALEDKDDEA